MWITPSIISPLAKQGVLNGCAASIKRVEEEKGSITLTTSFKRVIKKNVAEYLLVAKTLRNL